MPARESVPAPNFYYRQNEDGTVDAICLRCFLTAANATVLEELSKKELEHENYCFGRKCPVSIQFDASQARKHE
jgi:hypothetical protein